MQRGNIGGGQVDHAKKSYRHCSRISMHLPHLSSDLKLKSKRKAWTSTITLKLGLCTVGCDREVSPPREMSLSVAPGTYQNAHCRPCLGLRQTPRNFYAGVLMFPHHASPFSDLGMQRPSLFVWGSSGKEACLAHRNPDTTLIG
jgi:hypothetical protein